MPNKILIAEQHDQVYHAMRARGDRNVRLAHIDFHCDMRGLQIDRRRQRAFRKTSREADFVDLGNWLGHAIMAGVVTDLVWVHDRFGGRLHDDGGTVGYETDLFATWHAFRHQRRGGEERSIAYREIAFDDWEGPRPDDQLDIDWDALAALEYSPKHSRRLIDAFLARDFKVIPETTYLVFSPGHSHPDRDQFEDFAEKLAKTFSADIVQLPVPSNGSAARHDQQGILPGLAHRAKQTLRSYLPQHARQLRRSLIRSTRYLETRHDLLHPGP